jgi:hypothetical protein
MALLRYRELATWAASNGTALQREVWTALCRQVATHVFASTSSPYFPLRYSFEDDFNLNFRASKWPAHTPFPALLFPHCASACQTQSKIRLQRPRLIPLCPP